MPPLVHQPPIPDLANLIDAIGELKSAILDMHGSVRIGPILAVDIDDPRHSVCLSLWLPWVRQTLAFASSRSKLSAEPPLLFHSNSRQARATCGGEPNAPCRQIRLCAKCCRRSG